MHTKTPVARHTAPTRFTTFAVTFATLGLVTLALVLPHGDMAPAGTLVTDPVTGETRFDHDTGRMILRGIGNMFGTLAVLLVVASLVLSSARVTRGRFTHARRVTWHRRLGVGVIALAGAHVVLFLVEGSVRGWLPGLVSFALFAAHGATAALRARLIPAWGAGWWRFAHRASAWLALAFVVEHIVIASWHWGLAREFQEWGIGQ